MKRLILLVVLLLTLALLPTWLVRPWSAIELDLFSQELPFFFETRRMLLSGELPFWSWDTFVGDSFIGAYSFYTLTSPFVWLQSLLPSGWWEYSFWGVLYLKVILAAVCARIYLRQMGFSDLLNNTGAILYAFSNFFILNLYYWHFAEPAIMFPLLLFALERCMNSNRRGEFVLLTALVFATIFINFYFAVGSLLIAFGYMLLRLWGEPNALKRGMRCCLAALFGMGLAAPLLLTMLSYLSGVPRASQINLPMGHSALFMTLKRTLSPFFPRMTEGGYNEFNILGFTSIALYLPFVGALPALLYIKRRRDRYAWFTAALAVTGIIVPLTGVFTLFRDPYYMRWGYAAVLMLILLTLRFMRSGERLTRRNVRIYLYITLALGLFGVGMVLFSTYVYRSEVLSITNPFTVNNFPILLVLLLSFALLSLWARRGTGARFLLGSTMGVAGFCAMCQFFLWTHFAEKSYGEEYLLTSAWRADPHRFMAFDAPDTCATFSYRTVNLTGTPNYSLISGRPTLGGYSSCGPSSVWELYALLSTGSAPYPGITPHRHLLSSTALLSAKQVAHSPSDTELPEALKPHLSKRGYAQGIDIYDCDFYLPMGFAYDTYIPDETLRDIDGAQTDVPSLLLEHLALNASDTAQAAPYLRRAISSLSRYHTDDAYASANINLDSIRGRRALQTATDFRGTSRGWQCRTNLDSTRVMFFSVPFNKGFTFTLDGHRRLQPIHANLGMTALIIPAGTHTLTATYTPPGLLAGLYIAAITLLLLLTYLCFIHKITRKSPK